VKETRKQPWPADWILDKNNKLVVVVTPGLRIWGLVWIAESDCTR